VLKAPLDSASKKGIIVSVGVGKVRAS
jgi:hypothetical protein